jgi:spermidine/putrescine-binding protein
VIADADAIAVMHQLAVARGLPSPNLGPKQLAKLSKDLGALLRNVGMVVPSWTEATAALSQGAADLAVVGSEYMLAEADRYGATLDFDFFTESKGGGRTDVMVIPVNAGDPDLAYAYIDALISPQTNARFVTDLGYAAVNSLAVAELDPAAAIPYDYARLLFEDHRPGASCVETDPGAVPDLDEDIEPTLFEIWRPPAESGGGKVAEDDWYAAWDQARMANQ